GLGLGVAWTEGREAEAVAAGTVLETDVSGITVTGRHGLGRRWTVDWWLGTQEQGDFYRRRYAGLALAVEF
ncbi:MAG: YaiO family outer membrane beta-barrel protein, partial [Woeseiaceae bacterium]|nr:YaiO family outer membrane beta-barrel protein [Woeseiaceae bacterium]